MALKALTTCIALFNVPTAVQSASCLTNRQPVSVKCAGAATTCTEGTCCEWLPTRTCSDHACPAGMKAKSNAASLYCASSDCTDTTCCDADTTKCLGATVNCPVATQYKDASKNGVVGTTVALCCTDKAECSTLTCPAGYKQKTGTHYCATNTCAATESSTCCDADTTKCAGATVNCPVATQYKDTAKNGVVGTTVALCCTDKAACSTLNCPAGYKAKTGTHYCATNTCAAATDSNTCCEAEATKCAGMATVTCTYGSSYYWDTAKAGTAATAANKATVCCTEKASCSAAYPSSTAPSGSPGSTSGAEFAGSVKPWILIAALSALGWN